MAISKLARVRVEAFSKTMPRMRPGRVACGSRSCRRRRNSSARTMSASMPPSGRSQKLRKSLRVSMSLSSVCERGVEELHGLVDLGLGGDEGRREAQDVAARGGDEQPALGRARHDGGRLAVEHEALEQAPPARAARARLA